MRRTPQPSRLVPPALAVVVAVALLAGAGPAAAYVVILKDGTQISTRDKPVVRDGKAYFTLTSGMESFLPAAEIDLPRTEKANETDYGSARVIEGIAEAPPPSLPDEPPKQTLAQLARGSLSRPEARRRDDQASQLGPLPKTDAGFVDLMEVRRVDLGDLDVKTELARHLRGQGHERLAIYQGTQPDRILLDLPANSEAAVFKSLKDASAALLQLRQAFGERVGAIELILATSAEERRTRAGQFVLTAELAELLASGGMRPEEFFLKYVQF